MKKAFSIVVITLGILYLNKPCFAHQDFWITDGYKNVKIRIKTGFQFEEIQKIKMIGRMAAKLCKELNYNQPVFLDFNHTYTDYSKPAYFVSYDNGNIIYPWNNVHSKKDYLKKKSLVVRQVARQFSPDATLKLLEYAIINSNKISSIQHKISYNNNYCNWTINTVDTLITDSITISKPTTEVNKILSEINYIDTYNSGISYFFRDGNYHVYYKDFNSDIHMLLFTLNNIYQFEEISFTSALIFDTDTSFYYIDGSKNPTASTRHVLNNARGNYQPFTTKKIGLNRIMISFESFKYTPERRWFEVHEVYDIETGQLLGEINELIDKYKR